MIISLNLINLHLKTAKCFLVHISIDICPFFVNLYKGRFQNSTVEPAAYTNEINIFTNDSTKEGCYR